MQQNSEDFYLVVSRLVGYKRIDRAVGAFNRLKKRLLIVGDGPDRKRLEKMAGPTVQFLGRLSDQEVKSILERCHGLIFPGREDFGITPVEAQACGKPVIALAEGGAMETVVPGETGILFPTASEDSLADAVECAEETKWDPFRIRENANRFTKEVFVAKMEDFIERVVREKSPVN